MTKQNNIQPEKGNLLNTLHHNGKLLVLPNIWDPLGAILLESLGYAAVATASASIAFSNGYPDGEKIPFKELLHILRKIINSVTIPVTADIESGYATNNAELKENIKMLLDAGIAGINFEDTNKDDKTIISIEAQCEKLSLIRKKWEFLFLSMPVLMYISWQMIYRMKKNYRKPYAGEKLIKIQERIVSIPSH